MSAPTTVRADWGSVTLVEYAALSLLAHPDPLSVLGAVWDDIHAHNPFKGPDDEPTRLTPDGEAWLAAHVDTRRGTDERAEIAAARDVVKCLGILTVSAAGRLVRTGKLR